MNYSKIQEEELKTWNIEDPVVRKEKAMREWIRYPLLKKQMGLDYLDTSDMEVWDIGCGPHGGVAKILNAKKKVYIDPLADKYAKYYNTQGFVSKQAEALKEELAVPDLVIVTNALDHFEDPKSFLEDLVKYTKPGSFFAHFHAIDNAITHPHPAHVHNINPETFKEILHKDFEVVWYMDFKNDGLTYAWRKQPAFSGLYRKVTGYK